MVFSFMSLAGFTTGCKRVEDHVHSRACWTLDRNGGHFTSKCVPPASPLGKILFNEL